jgi:diguanylate cyclase (GGDEF)-like protein
VVRSLGRLRSVPGWSWFLGASIVLSAIFVFLPPDSRLGAAIYIGLGLAQLVAIVVGIRRFRPAKPRSWHLMMCGAGLYTVGNLIQVGWPVLLHGTLSFPSIADPFLLGTDLCFVAGLAVLIRARSGGGEGLGALLDAIILTFAVGIVAWQYLIDPLGTAAHTSTVARMVSISYPLFDLALLALVVRILITRAPRSMSFWLVCGFVVCQLAADGTYTVAILNGTFYYGSPIFVGWQLAFGCLGAAALHPTMGSLSDSPAIEPSTQLPLSRLVFLAVAVLVVPALYVLHPRSHPTDAFFGTIALFLLCIARMAVLVRELDRKTIALERRERELHTTVDLLHESQGDLAHMAQHDVLTGLPNRALFSQRLDAALAQASQSVAVMLLDLDGFKSVNDTLGHAAGDDLLVAVAGRLASGLRPSDTVARLGGDEFTILAVGLDENSIARLAGRLLCTLDEPIALEGQRVFARASLGIAFSGGDRPDRELLSNADAAMYEAKRKGGQRFEIFSADMHARLLDRLALECDLRVADLGGAITLNYQPLVDLRDGHLCGFEALLRWRHPERGMVSPDEFVPLAEETGLIVPVGLWVLRESCRQARAWADRHPYRPAIGMNVNVSARQLEEPGFVEDVARTLEQTGLDPALLTLEITETMMMVNEDDVCECLHRLKKLGLRISVDDFGTGYSSLAHLRRFPIDELKIDRTFVASIGDKTEGGGVAIATIRLARSLHIEVVAEGIERQDQLAELRRACCTRGQGYYFWKPMDADSAGVLLDGIDGSVLPPAELFKVLVVDDDSTFRSTACRILSAAGFETAQAATGRKALELAAGSHFDAVLLDVHLPDLDGLSVCRALKDGASAPGLTVVQISGSAVSVAARVRGLDDGADGYLVKPVAPAELVATVRATIRTRLQQPA